MRKLLTSKHLLPFQTRGSTQQLASAFRPDALINSRLNRAQAATPQTAPPQLKNLLTQIDAAQTSTMLRQSCSSMARISVIRMA